MGLHGQRRTKRVPVDASIHGFPSPVAGVGQNTEEWGATQLAPCMETFQKAFLEGCLRSNRQTLGSAARAAAAAPTLAF
jgi:hypothetical protein